ncbi:MAG: hypothetical protein ABW049_03395 [Spongiibacteraceae bacterium]
MTASRRFYGWTIAAALWFTFLLSTSLPFYGAGVINNFTLAFASLVVAVLAGALLIVTARTPRLATAAPVAC